MNKSQLNLIEFDCVVADECHVLKEKTSETTQAMNEVNALCRIGLTGTAIQNNSPTEHIEEETLLDYEATQFYPVHVGEILKSPGSAYEVVGKLGYGRNSTVWLCRNLEDISLYTIKVGTAYIKRDNQEAKIYNHLNDIRTSHFGQKYVRTLHEAFEMEGLDGSHHCLVHTPLGMNFSEFQDEFPDKKFPEYLLKPLLVCLLNALDFLHTEADILQARNILLSLADEQPLTDFVNAERDLPCARKVIDERRTIYTSRAVDFSPGNPILCDFGLSVFGMEHEGQTQSLPFRAPEVILGMKWNSKIDIWNLGVLTWDLFFNTHLFNGKTEQDQLEIMIAHLGPPTLEFLGRSEASKEYFDKHGVWQGPAIIHSPLEEMLDGEASVFLDFIRSMVAWAPEERKTAAELLNHLWLSERIEVGGGETTETEL